MRALKENYFHPLSAHINYCIRGSWMHSVLQLLSAFIHIQDHNEVREIGFKAFWSTGQCQDWTVPSFSVILSPHFNFCIIQKQPRWFLSPQNYRLHGRLDLFLLFSSTSMKMLIKATCILMKRARMDEGKVGWSAQDPKTTTNLSVCVFSPSPLHDVLVY